jgi:hypothetical protein
MTLRTWPSFKSRIIHLYEEEIARHIQLFEKLQNYPPMKMGQCVPKRRHIKFRRRGITQRKAYNIQNMAKV